jgi:hypothetical protein
LEPVFRRKTTIDPFMTETQARTVLGLPSPFTLEQLKRQYRAKVLISHPDKNKGDNSRFLIVKQAYELLLQRLQDGNFHRHTNIPNRETQQRRHQAEYQYKQRVRRDIDWAKMEENKKKRYQSEFAENAKYGCLIVVIITILSFVLGSLFDPEFNGEKDKQRNALQEFE